MDTGRKMLLVITLSCFIMSGCHPQNNEPAKKQVDRQPAVAGSFYPSDPDELKKMLADLFSKAKPASVKNVQAIICPHAGYIFSGIVAASSFNQVDPKKKFDNIFVIGSSHRVAFMGASVYTLGDYVTPLGHVPVNTEIANKLIKENPFFMYNPDADRSEHSVEVQIPFLQYHMKNGIRIVPIVLGTQSEQTCRKIAGALKPYFNENNLFVISTDFSHYPSYTEAQSNDKRTCDAILTGSGEKLMKVLKENDQKDIPNLATSLCGWTSVLTLLGITGDDPSYQFIPVFYQNSGDSRYADKSQVVGYWSVAVTRQENARESRDEFSFTNPEKKELLKIARITIEKYIKDHTRPVIDANGFSANLKMKAGAFVTLKENGELRGCVGRFTSDDPLYLVVQEMAIASSTEDNRFPPVTADEISKLEIEISVLSPMKKINSIDEIILGKHGIYIKKGWNSGTFLPQVANETGWTKEDFLGHCARDKAGIGWDGWKDADIYIYEASVFSESEVNVHKD